MRAYFQRVDTWTFLRPRSGPCPVAGCQIQLAHPDRFLCNFHMAMLPRDLAIDGRYETELLETDDGELIEHQVDLLPRLVVIAKASEDEHIRLGL
jgi:hypothetical protein